MLEWEPPVSTRPPVADCPPAALPPVAVAALPPVPLAEKPPVSSALAPASAPPTAASSSEDPPHWIAASESPSTSGLNKLIFHRFQRVSAWQYALDPNLTILACRWLIIASAPMRHRVAGDSAFCIAGFGGRGTRRARSALDALAAAPLFSLCMSWPARGVGCHGSCHRRVGRGLCLPSTSPIRASGLVVRGRPPESTRASVRRPGLWKPFRFPNRTSVLDARNSSRSSQVFRMRARGPARRAGRVPLDGARCREGDPRSGGGFAPNPPGNSAEG
jgi:hypothetical protein